MAVDHTRPLPVAPERIEYIANQLYAGSAHDLTAEQSYKVLTLAMQGEQVEYLQSINQALWDAHDIYNGRFRI